MAVAAMHQGMQPVFVVVVVAGGDAGGVIAAMQLAAVGMHAQVDIGQGRGQRTAEHAHTDHHQHQQAEQQGRTRAGTTEHGPQGSRA